MDRFLQAISEHVVIFDGAMGTSLQALDLTEADTLGLENCSEVLNLTRPDAIGDVHRAYLAAGADAVETNTFGASRPTLREFGLDHRVEEVNRRAVAIAREACAAFTTPERPRFVVGSLGPGTRLPSLGQVTWEELEAAYAEQAAALVRGGVDALLLETSQDLLQVRAALVGIFGALEQVGRAVPVMAQVTLEPTGTMLAGSDAGAALAVVEAWPVAAVGLNCATGPREMAPHVAFLGRHCRRTVSVQPNAGLPVREGERTVFPLSPDEFAEWLHRFVEEDGVGIVGGCCGTTPAHIAAVARRLGRRPPRSRQPVWEPSVASLYQAVALRQDADVFAVGERTNANGSAAFRTRLQAEDWEGIVGLGRSQVRQGAHAVDVCTAMVGRDEGRDMVEVVRRFATQVQAPVVVDSTDPDVVEAALRRLPGRSIVNSVNLEAGIERAAATCRLARRHGAALVALCIDEEGMARTPERKLAVAERLHDLALAHGLATEDLLFDPLTFTVATGQEEDRSLARWTLEGVRAIATRFPRAGILLGVSNVSFGFKPPARKVLNSVFLHHAREAGLTAAIIHPTGILPLFQVPEDQRKAAEDLLFDRRDQGDPLTRFMALFAEATAGQGPPEAPDRPVEERLVARVVDGDRDGLDRDLEEALRARPALSIINDLLLAGMRTVGEHFAAGRTQLPFVLASAEVVKAAVDWLEPHLDRSTGRSRGRMVIATVRGDVHDIGKNLVHILLANNGFEVVDLGTRVPVERILATCRDVRPDAVGLSGLLVKSTLAMREDLQEMRRQGLDVPVVLGGAALSRGFVERECTAAYGRPVAYAADAFAGLAFMEELEAARNAGVASRWEVPVDPERLPEVRPRPPRSAVAEEAASRPLPLAEVPTPPFVGSRRLGPVPLETVVPFLDRKALFRFHWGFRSASAAPDLDALLDRWLRRVQEEDLLDLQATYGFFPCHAEPGCLVVQVPGASAQRLAMPRGPAGYGVADYFRPAGGPPDVVAFLAVTVGERAIRSIRGEFERGAYQDYLLLHGLAVECTEALAAWLHRRIRQELGIAGDDGPTPEDLLRNRHRGRRYAWGYPALPDLEPQRKVLDILGADGVGITMDPDGQLRPELSTTAVVTHHPDSRYFRV